MGGVSAVPVQMWQTGRAESRCRCGRGEPIPGADAVHLRPVAPLWGRAFVVWALLGISGQGSAEVQASWLKACATTHRDARGLEREVELADPLPQREVGVFLQASLRRAARVRCAVSITHALYVVDRFCAAEDWGHFLFSSATSRLVRGVRRGCVRACMFVRASASASASASARSWRWARVSCLVRVSSRYWMLHDEPSWPSSWALSDAT